MNIEDSLMAQSGSPAPQGQKKHTYGTYTVPQMCAHVRIPAAINATARPHAPKGIACSVCTGDLSFPRGNVMQCKEIIHSICSFL